MNNYEENWGKISSLKIIWDSLIGVGCGENDVAPILRAKLCFWKLKEIAHISQWVKVIIMDDVVSKMERHPNIV